METSPLIFQANQWTGFYMAGTSIIKGLIFNSDFFQESVNTLDNYLKAIN